jgi:hypothetical protein
MEPLADLAAATPTPPPPTTTIVTAAATDIGIARVRYGTPC